MVLSKESGPEDKKRWGGGNDALMNLNVPSVHYHVLY